MNVATLQPAPASTDPTAFQSVLAGDPIFDLIAKRQSAMASYKACLDIYGAAETAVLDGERDGSPDLKALEATFKSAEALTNEASSAEMAAWNAVIDTKPTTVAGARALITAIQKYELEWHADEGDALLSVANRLCEIVEHFVPDVQVEPDNRAAAILFTDPLRRTLYENYHAWLHFEHRYLTWEASGGDIELAKKLESFVCGMNEGFSFHNKDRARPAIERASVVLDAVGCNWRKVDPDRADAAELRAAVKVA